MSAVPSSAERRPPNDLSSNKTVGRDSVEPFGNDVSEWNFATADASEIVRRRLLSIRGEPLFYANWDNVTFIHYQTDPQELQRCIPYHLDLYDGNAFVSLIAFTMREMRPRFGGSLSALFFKPISTYHFLNVRTYVTCEAEPGIYFMQEWLSSRLATWLGPCSFGLPNRFARMDLRAGFARRIFTGALHRFYAIRESPPILSHLARTVAASSCGDPNRE
jgi:uncharacterized protein YqjF (DUF2071 family)